MKKILQIISAAFFACIFALTVSAQTNSSEIIRNFDVTAFVNLDSSVSVAEHIVYDFGTTDHHGIFRDIPIKYDTQLGNQSIKLSDIKVVDEKGEKYQFTTSSKGKDWEIKIGDPDTYITGVHTYAISYKVDRAVGYFNDHDELYWNATGNEWPVPIEHASLLIALPIRLENNQLTFSCYFGTFGSNTTCMTEIPVLENSTTTTIATFTSPRKLEIGEGLTGALGFPKGIIHQATQSEIVLQFLKDNWIAGLPIVVFFCMLALWWRKGRDPRGRSTIIPEYEAPDNLSPLEVSSLMHQGMRQKDISAEIIALAVKGYLTITRSEEKHFLGNLVDYTFEKKHPASSHVISEADTLLLAGLFGADITVKMSSLKQKFYVNIPLIKKSVNNGVVRNEYFEADPSKVTTKYIIWGCLFFALIWVLSFFPSGVSPISAVSIVISGVIFILFSFIMPRHSKKGVLAKQSVLGLKEYLQIAEKDRINFHNAPEKNPKLFEKLLPYAMILGVEKAWAKEFEDIYTTPPSWYNDPTGSTFNSLIFVHNISAFSSTAVSNLTTAPGGSSGSGGGGFSGGGGGGGGGGSW